MDSVEVLLLVAGACVIALAVVIVFVFPALGGDYRKGHDIGPGGPDS